MNYIFIIIPLFLLSVQAEACRMAFPSENRCESTEKKVINKKLIYNLKKTIETYYNKRDKFLATKKVGQPSSCFNLRHAEMYVNYILQILERSDKICLNHLERLLETVNQMVDPQSEENRFIKSDKEKLVLIDLAMEISRYSEALKLEIGSL